MKSRGKQCCQCGPVLDGFKWIKWDDNPVKEKLYFKKYVQCREEAIVEQHRDGFTFAFCKKHMRNEWWNDKP